MSMAPLYDYLCSNCGDMELHHSIHLPALKKCPECKAKGFRRVILQAPLMKMPDAHWEDESGGRGRYIAQLAEKIGDPNAYCRSRNEIREKAKKAGFTKIEDA